MKHQTSPTGLWMRFHVPAGPLGAPPCLDTLTHNTGSFTWHSRAFLIKMSNQFISPSGQIQNEYFLTWAQIIPATQLFGWSEHINTLPLLSTVSYFILSNINNSRHKGPELAKTLFSYFQHTSTKWKALSRSTCLSLHL